MNTNLVKSDFIAKYRTVGPDRFYNLLIMLGLDRLSKMKDKKYDGVSPELELMDYYEKILAIYRRGEGDADFLALASLFRRAAHKIYRTGLKQKLLRKSNRFLNLVKSK